MQSTKEQNILFFVRNKRLNEKILELADGNHVQTGAHVPALFRVFL
jgi:hypothetical protein